MKLALLALAAVAAFPATAAAQEAVPGEVVVQYESGGLHVVKLRGHQTVRAEVRKLRAEPRVRYAEPNYIYRASAIPNDPQFNQLWGMVKINAPAAWDLTKGNASVKVAVVDSGIAYDHEDLAGNMWSNPGEIASNGMDDDHNGFVDDVRGYDFVNNDADPRDVNGHGTHVAGTIGAVGNNGIGVTGVNWDVSLMAVRALGAGGFGTTDSIAQAFDYAGDNGARVVNASLGGAGQSQIIENVIATHPNTLYVVAAGNEASNNDATPSIPCSYPDLNVVCVAATTQADGLAGFSNLGATSVDLGAPGTGIRSSVPQVISFEDDFESNPFTARWDTGGTSLWAWVGNATNSFVQDSFNAPYAPNADTWIATALPLTGSGIGCKVSFVTSLDVEDGVDFLDLETSPDGADPWTLQDFWTGTFGDFIETGFDGDGVELHLRFQLEADGSIQGDGAAIDNVDVDCVQPGPGDYAAFDGTSMATPHVAGVAALALALRPSLTVSQLRDVLLSSGDPVSALAGKTVTGRRLNARGALQAPPSRTPTTGAATAITTTSATLTGAVNPLGTPTSFQFQYGTSAAYGSATAAASAGAGVGARAVGAAVAGLAPATTYHYRAVWIRGAERAFGADRAFTTAALPKTLADVKLKRCRVRGKRLRCPLVEFGAVKSATLRLKKGRKTIARKTVRPSSSGVLTLKLKRKLKKGRYSLTLTLRDAAGHKRTLRRTVRI